MPFAQERIRKEIPGILTGAVGMITEPAQADAIIQTGQADIVLLAREMLRDPYWPMPMPQLPWGIRHRGRFSTCVRCPAEVSAAAVHG